VSGGDWEKMHPGSELGIGHKAGERETNNNIMTNKQSA